ncbi:methyltransferase, TIGR04325 family [Acidicapsa ligni]|uniref:methyltransferase, TIGR04325 family n=1 Tax=Acidicapsa ligni TaxID=542300 RepID=UPI0021DF64DA|nr:methyltransferase, TIGR04325 family [Acidicapsa ligni]
MYSSFAAALAAIPTECRIGYDQEETKNVFLHYPTARVRPADYPILLHIRNLAKPGGRVLDLGGNIGMAYYTTLKYFPLPESFSWIVCDLPKVIEAGKEVAQREGNPSAGLKFIATPDLPGLSGADGKFDIFFSSGTLQYIETPVAETLRQLPELPETVLINRIPTWEKAPLFTVQDIGFCICPYQIFNHQAFVKSIEDLGYRLVDDWNCPESTFSVKFHPKVRLNSYHGFYFTRI